MREEHERLDDALAASIGLTLVGFGPPRRLAAIVRHDGWTGRVLGDAPRELYRRVGAGRGRWWRVYSPGTLLTYARSLLPGRAGRTGRPLPRTEEDLRQLGADAVLVDGTVVALWLPRTPNDRPPAPDVLAAAVRALA